MSLDAIELLRQRIARHAIDCDWVDGQMLTAIKPRQWRALQDWHQELTDSLGYDQRAADRNTMSCARCSRSERYIGALYDTNGGHLHPLRYTLGLARAAAAAGAQFYEDSAMLDYRSTRRPQFVSARPAAASIAPSSCWRATPGWAAPYRNCSAS